jgi:folate-binding protein YgfZ
MSSHAVAAPSAAEMDALREAVAFDRQRGSDRLDLSGEDRVRFLHNLITCEVRELSPDSSVRGFLTQVRGGVLADVEVIVLGDRHRLVLPAGRGGAIRLHLEKHRIIERVEIEGRDDLVGIDLRGAGAERLLAELGVAVPSVGNRVPAEIGGRSVAVRARGRGNGLLFEIEAAVADAEPIVADLDRAGAGHGLLEISDAARTCARIEDGELAWGVDYGEESFPQETGEEEAVSYTKGCFLGQEVVARIHYRGGVQRRARGVRFAGPPPAPGTALLHDGREAGKVTSIAVSPHFGPIGLALVHRRVGEPPAEVGLDGGGQAEIVALPFGRSAPE